MPCHCMILREQLTQTNQHKMVIREDLTLKTGPTSDRPHDTVHVQQTAKSGSPRGETDRDARGGPTQAPTKS